MKVIINENILEQVNKGSLPKSILKSLISDEHSLSKHPTFPNEGLHKFEIILLKKRYLDILDKLERIGLSDINKDSVNKVCNDVINRIKELEEPIKEDLELVCIKVIQDLFKIDKNIIDFECTLGDGEVSDNRSDEPIDEDFEFNDTTELNRINDLIYKRRLINSLINGVSETLVNQGDLYLNEIYKLNPELLKLYQDFFILNNYLLFENESCENNGTPEVIINKDINNSIKVVSNIFPTLLYDSIKGVLDLISFNALPQEKELCQFILNKADFKKADIWDERFGFPLWEKIDKHIDNKKNTPFIFHFLVNEEIDDFNKIMNEIFSETKYGKTYLYELCKDVDELVKLNNLTSDLDKQRVIYDSIKEEYYSYDEL